jgi:hypothetical protein
MVSLDIEDRPIRRYSAQEIMDDWFQLRLPYYYARKNNILQDLAKVIQNLDHKIRFIQAVIAGHQNGNQIIIGTTIVFIGQSKDYVYEQMDALSIPHELLKKVSSFNYTTEEIERLMREMEAKRTEYAAIDATPPEKMWYDDLIEFEAAYCRHYKCSPGSPSTVALDIVG